MGGAKERARLNKHKQIMFLGLLGLSSHRLCFFSIVSFPASPVLLEPMGGVVASAAEMLAGAGHLEIWGANVHLLS